MSDDRYRAGQESDGRLICGAKTRAGKPCRLPPVEGRTRCRMHGGASPRGIAHPRTKHGRFSRDMPTRMLATYEAALADEDLISLLEEIALVTAREGDLLSRVDSGESGEIWTALRKAWAEYESAVAASNAPAMAYALTDIGRLLHRGHEDHLAWRELLATIEQRRRLVETERRRLVDLNQMISHERAMLFATALLDAVRRNVDDRDALARVSADFQRLFRNRGPDDGEGSRGTDA